VGQFSVGDNKRDHKAQTTTEHYYHIDHVGAAQSLSNQAGEVTWRGYSEAFGKTWVDVNTQPMTTDVTSNNLTSPGQYEDPETGGKYNYFRDYDPTVGRYKQSDPLGLQGGMNTYTYVRGNPILNFDNFGLLTCSPLVCIPNLKNTKLVSSTKTKTSKWELENVHVEPVIRQNPGFPKGDKGIPLGFHRGMEVGVCFFARYHTFIDIYKSYRQVACLEHCFEENCEKNSFVRWHVYEEDLGTEEKVRRERESLMHHLTAPILVLACRQLLDTMR
jgi:RHS repeat-associated protein